MNRNKMPARRPVTMEYARFTAGLNYDDLPPAVVNVAKDQILATIGSCLAGTRMPGAEALRRGSRILGSGREATLFGLPEKVPAPTAALFNAGTGQIIEWDDWVLISHTGACVVPTAFATAEALSRSGRDVISAVVIGNEVAGRTSRAIQRGAYLGNGMPNHQAETSLVAGHVMGLDPVALARSVSHSAYMAMENCFLGWSSDSKVLINGLPAMWGIVSANLAKEGLIGNLDMIEHPAGYLATVSEEVDHDELLKGLGQDWYTLTLNTKRYPSCAYNLAAIESAIALNQRIGTDAMRKVKKIVIHCPGVTIYVSGRYHGFQPDIRELIRDDKLSHMGLCFDGGYAVAASLVDGKLTYRQFLKERIFDPEITRLHHAVEYRTDPEMQAAYYSDYQYGSRLELHMEDGTVLAEERKQLLGARDRTFDHIEKFLEGAEDVLSPAQAGEAAEALRSLETIQNINEVGALLRPKN
ncbi:MAG: MmgE/PrpD family protein [Burkholderiaceae bacterium]